MPLKIFFFLKKVNNSLIPFTIKSSKKKQNNTKANNNINGITISPKKNFCIIKIWISNCDNTDPNIIKNIDGLFPNECFFKKHI